MMRPGDERVLLTLYFDDSVRATYATAAMQADYTHDLAVTGEHDPYGVPLLTARHVLDGDTRHRAVIAFGHTTKDT